MALTREQRNQRKIAAARKVAASLKGKNLTRKRLVKKDKGEKVPEERAVENCSGCGKKLSDDTGWVSRLTSREQGYERFCKFESIRKLLRQ